MNVQGTLNILEVAREIKQSKTFEEVSVFAPSSIAVFGPSTPADNTPDDIVCDPTTMYGISKVRHTHTHTLSLSLFLSLSLQTETGFCLWLCLLLQLHLECLGNYFKDQYGIDFRSLRFPGVISATAPGGGTTDYVMDMYTEALKYKQCTSFLSEDIELPFMHMEDCLRSTTEFIMAPKECLSRRVYNVTAFSATPEQVYESILKFIPDCKVSYEPDYREDIALTWPNSIDDHLARRDWKWQHAYGLDDLTQDILQALQREERERKANAVRMKGELDYVS